MLLAVALLASCSAREGTVLIARDVPRDGQVALGTDAAVERDAGVGLDSGSPSVPDASAGVDAAALAGTCRIEGATSGFYEDFAGTAWSDSWLIAHGTHTFAGSAARGGFVRENVAVRDGMLILSVRGDRYAGPVRGIDERGAPRADGRRTAAALVTRDLFASGTYQVQGRFVAPSGVELALWVMADDDRAGGADIAVPGLADLGTGSPTLSYGAVRMRSRSGRDASQAALSQFALAQSLDDGQSHILRFDWYTTAQPSVQFWVDDQRRWGTDEQVLDGATRRLWIVAWVPDDAPADFETAEIRVENAFVTPFGNAGDRCSAAFVQSPGLVAPR